MEQLLTSHTFIPNCSDYHSPHELHKVVYSLVLVAGLPLNVLALWIFLRKLRVHSVVSVYMCNLAASDLLFTLSLPLRLTYYAQHQWNLPDLVCQASGAIFQMNMYGSCVFLALINMDRYAAIVHPLRLRHLRHPRVARRLCLGVWALILVSAVPTALVHRPSVYLTANGSRVRLCFEGFSSDLWRGHLLPLVLLAEMLGFLLPLVAVFYSSVRVFWVLARPNATRSQRRRKTVRLLLANLIIFLLCFVPYNTTLAVYGLMRGDLLTSTPDVRCQVRRTLMVMVLLAGSNCVLDPLIYYFSAEGFRNTLRDLSTPLRARTLARNGTHGELGTRAADTLHTLPGPDGSGTAFLQCPGDAAL